MAKRGVARLGDLISHGGSITGASPDSKANSIRIARLGDTAQCNRHGTVTIASASTFVRANSRGIARINDVVSCGARIVSASLNVFIGSADVGAGLLADDAVTPLLADDGRPLIA